MVVGAPDQRAFTRTGRTVGGGLLRPVAPAEQVAVTDGVVARVQRLALPGELEQPLGDAALVAGVLIDRAAPRVEIEWETIGAEVVIAVRDNGPGLTNASNLFVPFYTTKPGGTGIGLVLAQQIAQAHRGSVQLSNRIDGQIGCKADLRLPIAG